MSNQAGSEIMQGLRIFSLPPAAKWALLALLVFTGLVNTVLFVSGLMEKSKHEWVKASLELMAVILPFLVIAIVLFFSSSIADQASRKTVEFLLQSAPRFLAALVERNAPFMPPGGRVDRAQLTAPRTVQIQVRHSPGSCCADYWLTVPPADNVSTGSGLELFLRMELNIRRLTINIGIEKNHVPKEYWKNENGALSWFLSNFVNTLRGAFEEPPQDVAQSKIAPTGYSFNRLIIRDVEGRKMYCFVATKDVGSEFLWDASERLFILQDLTFMLRALLSENAALFRRLPTAGTEESA